MKIYKPLTQMKCSLSELSPGTKFRFNEEPSNCGVIVKHKEEILVIDVDECVIVKDRNYEMVTVFLDP